MPFEKAARSSEPTSITGPLCSLSHSLASLSKGVSVSLSIRNFLTWAIFMGLRDCLSNKSGNAACCCQEKVWPRANVRKWKKSSLKAKILTQLITWFPIQSHTVLPEIILVSTSHPATFYDFQDEEKCGANLYFPTNSFKWRRFLDSEFDHNRFISLQKWKESGSAFCLDFLLK